MTAETLLSSLCFLRAEPTGTNLNLTYDVRLTHHQWYPEISHFLESTPTLLVASKTDLRSDPLTLSLMAAQGTAPISRSEGEAVAREIGAKYHECSSKTGVGVKEVFQGALKESMSKGFFGVGGGGKKKGGKKACVVL